MALAHIAHYLIAANDVQQTGDWYCDVLGLEEGWDPDRKCASPGGRCNADS